jgi:hypothetical protein
MKKYIAERKLLYSNKGSDVRYDLVIRISEPYLIERDEDEICIDDEPAFGCSVDVVGLDVDFGEFQGADSLQALQLASDIDPIIRFLQKYYDIFWSWDEPYFDD